MAELQRIDYAAPATCATAELFFDEIRSRTPRLHLTLGDEWVVRFEIAVNDAGDHFVGALTVHADQTSSERREVTAKSCEEVLESLALIVSVAIDRNASLIPRPAPLPPPPAPARTNAAPVRVPIVQPPRPAPKNDAVRQGVWWQALGAGVEARGALASDVALAGMLSFEIGRDLPPQWGWAVRLAALRTLQSEVRDPFDRAARFRWTAGRVDAGPFLMTDGRLFSLQPALGFDVGAVEAQSERSATQPWISVLALLRARWSPTPQLALEAVTGAFVPLKRDKFVLFEQNSTVFRERALSGFLGLSAGVRLH